MDHKTQGGTRMPSLMEFVRNEEEIQKIMSYPNDLSDHWHKGGSDMLILLQDMDIL